MKRGITMFNITGDFSHGAYLNGGLNGFSTMVMQRDQDIQNVIKDFEAAIAAGLNPNQVKDTILKDNGITHLTAAESTYIVKKVEEIYKSRRGTNEFI
jgi:hypothetical protein